MVTSWSEGQLLLVAYRVCCYRVSAKLTSSATTRYTFTLSEVEDRSRLFRCAHVANRLGLLACIALVPRTLQDSSFWHSYYRCVSIHATNGTRLSRNVAHDITGYCYYLEDGVENGNVRTSSYRLCIDCYDLLWDIRCNDTDSRIQLGFLGPHAVSGASAFPPAIRFASALTLVPVLQGSYFPTTGTSAGQFMDDQSTSSYLVLPADTTAAGFYITNVNNNLTGNVAAGGWSGFVSGN